MKSNIQHFVRLGLSRLSNKRWRYQWLAFVSFLIMPMVLCAEPYLTTAQFLESAFGASQPKMETLWVTKDVAVQVENILGHTPKQLRVRYWKSNLKTAWILEEIGKEEPITAGFVIQSGKLNQVMVLDYRESRGGEVRHPNFLRQYQGADLQKDYQLDKSIDGISGATLSVRAIGRMVRLALYFDHISRLEPVQIDSH